MRHALINQTNCCCAPRNLHAGRARSNRARARAHTHTRTRTEPKRAGRSLVELPLRYATQAPLLSPSQRIARTAKHWLCLAQLSWRVTAHSAQFSECNSNMVLAAAPQAAARETKQTKLTPRRSSREPRGSRFAACRIVWFIIHSNSDWLTELSWWQRRRCYHVELVA